MLDVSLCTAAYICLGPLGLRCGCRWPEFRQSLGYLKWTPPLSGIFSYPRVCFLLFLLNPNILPLHWISSFCTLPSYSFLGVGVFLKG